MKTANFPRAVMMGVNGHSFPFHTTEDDWLISITDAEGEDAKIEKHFDQILFMKFDDTDKVGSFKEIQLEQAREIATFISKAREGKKNVWVNCHAGICRSGAVVSLLGELGWDIVDHIDSPGRIPNHLVYNMVRKFFPEVRQSWDPPVETDIWLAAKGW